MIWHYKYKASNSFWAMPPRPSASEIHHYDCYDLDPYQKILNPPFNTYVPNDSKNSFPL